MNDDDTLRFDQQTMRFDHSRNVHIGAGRIIFDPERGGWALPGGKFTDFHEDAVEAAKVIDSLLRSAQ